MPRYRVDVYGVFEIEAANVVQAALVSRVISIIGDRSGWRRVEHDPAGTRYSIRCISQTIGQPIKMEGA